MWVATYSKQKYSQPPTCITLPQLATLVVVVPLSYITEDASSHTQLVNKALPNFIRQKEWDADMSTNLYTNMCALQLILDL